MCGIAGICNFNAERIDSQLIKRMINTMIRRGPDDEGMYISFKEYPQRQAQVGLGHRRLSIIDLKTGHQPMANENNTIWIVFNGEIYNFLGLREMLLNKGHRFKTRSDTEVILHLYEDAGLDCVQSLRGMFAFAIWDSEKEHLFLARDRVGKKPLVYYFDGKNFIFASEIKAILQNNIKREVDLDSLDYFLSFGYIPSPHSILKEIHKLSPAHILIYDKNGVRTERYWRLSYRKTQVSFSQAKIRLEELLQESVRLRMISDVPLGAFLSGGMDSSTVVAIMSELSNSPVKTFTIGFEEEDYSEQKFARQIAKQFNTEHYEFMVKPNAFEILNKLVWHYNEPFGDSSCIPTYYVAKMTRQIVPVALCGDGGDETFGGYERYRGMYLAKRLQYLPSSMVNLIIALLKINQDLSKKIVSFLMARLNIHARPRYFEGLLMGLHNYADEWKRYISWVSIFQEEQKGDLYSDYFKSQLNNEAYVYIFDLVANSTSFNSIEKAMELDVHSYLPEDILVKVDIATMANSLEARSPFLDQKLMEFVASLPLDFKMRFLKTKYILKRLARDLLPEEILKRKKMGFAIPLDKWFRQELKQFSYDALLDKASLSRGYFRKKYIKTLLDEHSSGKFNHGARIWSLLNLEIWHRTFIDQAAPQEITV